METFLNGLSEFTGIPTENFTAAVPFFKKLTIPKGTPLLAAGEVASNLWFITSGMLRAYYYEADLIKRSVDINNSSPVEVTTWIVPAFGFLTDISSFLCQKPGHYYIETLENSVLYQLSFNNYKELSEKFPGIGHLTHERTFELLDMRVRMCGLRVAEDRLAMFEQQYPGITCRLPVNIQASYLNIDRSTLSRIRSKRN